VLQCGTVRCSGLQYDAVGGSVFGLGDHEDMCRCVAVLCSMLQCGTVRCSGLQCVALCSARVLVEMCVIVFQRFAVLYSAMQCVAVCCSMLQCVIVRCSVLQYVAVCCSMLLCVAIWHMTAYIHIFDVRLNQIYVYVCPSNIYICMYMYSYIHTYHFFMHTGFVR